MKKLPIMAAMFGLLALASCKDDEGGTRPITNSVTFDGNTYSFKTGIVGDYGTFGGHYNLDFTLVDRTANEIRSMAGGEYTILYVELFSPTTNAFEVGTFEYYNGTDTEGKYYFNSAEFEKFDADTETTVFEYEATGGSVTVSGGMNNEYTISYDLTMEGGKKLSGSYKGTFEDEDDVFGEAAPDNGARQQRIIPLPIK